MSVRTILLPVFLALGTALAQPAFDVASVKTGGPVRPDGLLDINLGSDNHGTVTLSNATLSECIRYAWNLANEDQIAGPEWIRNRSFRYGIVAKAPPETPIDQLRSMLRTLLIQRFRIETHREPRRVPHYLLTVSKTGSKMRVSDVDAPSVRSDYSAGHLSWTHLSMDRFVLLLSRLLKQPVLNQTALAGAFDIELTWRPEDVPAESAIAPAPDIFNAMQGQLGLKLEPSKEPLEVLVIDRAERVPIAD